MKNMRFLAIITTLAASIVLSTRGNDMCVEFDLQGLPSRIWMEISLSNDLPATFTEEVISQNFFSNFVNEHISEYQKYESPKTVPTLTKDVTEQVKDFGTSRGLDIQKATLHAEPYDLSFIIFKDAESNFQILLVSKKPLTQELGSTFIEKLIKVMNQTNEFLTLQEEFEKNSSSNSIVKMQADEEKIKSKYKELELLQKELELLQLDCKKAMNELGIIDFEINFGQTQQA